MGKIDVGWWFQPNRQMKKTQAIGTWKNLVNGMFIEFLNLRDSLQIPSKYSSAIAGVKAYLKMFSQKLRGKSCLVLEYRTPHGTM